jgi:hypothetical protein
MSDSLVSFTPANIVVTGKSATEKRMSVASVAGTVSTMFIAAGKGKAAVMARENLGLDSVKLMAKSVADGNYRPLAEALAFTMGESIQFHKLADLDGFVFHTEHAIANLKDEGYSVKTGKATAKLTMLTTAQNLTVNVVAAANVIVAERVEARKQAKLAASV